MYIPDPIERMDARIDDLMFEWDLLQKGVANGKFRCPNCRNIYEGEPIQVNPSPDSSACCYECLSPETKEAYDRFHNQ